MHLNAFLSTTYTNPAEFGTSVIPTGTHLPAQWEDGVYSVQGAAEAIGVYPGTINKWLKRGVLPSLQEPLHLVCATF